MVRADRPFKTGLESLDKGPNPQQNPIEAQDQVFFCEITPDNIKSDGVD